MTIIARVVDALRAHGNHAEADELQQVIQSMRDNIEQLLVNVKRQGEIARMLVNVMQARCKHADWYLVSTNVESNPATWGPEDTIACHECGHTVCDEQAWKHGRRVLEGGGSFLCMRNNPRLFGLDLTIRRHLGDKLIVKEIKDDADQKALRVACHSVGKGSTTNVVAPSASGDGGDGRSVGA